MRGWSRGTRLWVGLCALGVVGCVLAAAVLLWSRRGVPVGAPVISGSPTPVVSCEPDPAGRACTPELAAEQAETGRLQRDAEAAFRTSYEEWMRLRRQGGALEPTPPLLATTGEQYLEDRMKILRDQKARGYVVEGTPTLRIARDPGESRSGSDGRLTLRTCEDTSAMERVERGQRFRGGIVQLSVFSKVVDGHVKIVDQVGGVTTRCEI